MFQDEIEDEEQDEEMDDENDYGNNYFDDGGNYLDEDDNLDDGPTYWTLFQNLINENKLSCRHFWNKKNLLEKSLFLWYEYKDLNSHEVDSWLFAVSVS